MLRGFDTRWLSRHTCWLSLRRGALPFVEIIPEGFEDIDCLAHGSKRWFVPGEGDGSGSWPLDGGVARERDLSTLRLSHRVRLGSSS